MHFFANPFEYIDNVYIQIFYALNLRTFAGSMDTFSRIIKKEQWMCEKDVQPTKQQNNQQASRASFEFQCPCDLSFERKN